MNCRPTHTFQLCHVQLVLFLNNGPSLWTADTDGIMSQLLIHRHYSPVTRQKQLMCMISIFTSAMLAELTELDAPLVQYLIHATTLETMTGLEKKTLYHHWLVIDM